MRVCGALHDIVEIVELSLPAYGGNVIGIDEKVALVWVAPWACGVIRALDHL